MGRVPALVVAAMRTIRLRPRGAYVSAVATNELETTLESDSHADTCCLGQGALILQDYLTPVQVQGYDPADGTKQYRLVSGALAFDCPHTDRTYHLIINQAVEIPNLPHHLLCPMQCRVNDVRVNDTPKFLTDNPTEETHAIVAHDEYNDKVVLPFMLKGVTSYLPVRSLTQEEFDRNEAVRVHLTNQDLTWDPSSGIYEEQENAMTDFQGHVRKDQDRRPVMVINSISSTTVDAADITHDDNFARVLQSQVNVSATSVVRDSTTKYGDIGSQRKKQVSQIGRAHV